jgi:hypothetical protein
VSSARAGANANNHRHHAAQIIPHVRGPRHGCCI